METKFRGQRADNKEWVYGSLIIDAGNLCNYIVEQTFDLDEPHLDTQFGVDAWEVIPETVGQFTGLKDKEGTEIYEGDKVRINFAHGWECVGFHCGTPYNLPTDYEYYDCEVYYEDGSFKIYLPDCGEELVYDNCLSNLIEDPTIMEGKGEGILVIGNKWEEL